jgi:hypothetical protein
MPKAEIDYSNTIIYKIFCKDESVNDVYVGHTTNFTKRKYMHKNCCTNLNNKIKIYNIIRDNGGWDNWEMVEIAKYNCKDHTEARIKEQEHYELLKSSLNSCNPYVDKTKYFCKLCNKQYHSKTEYNVHINSKIHKKYTEQLEVQNPHENIYKFSCTHCDYYTCNKKDFNKHISTQKHQWKGFGKKLETLEIPKSPTHICKCNKTFATHSGLWKHKKKCKILNNDNIHHESEDEYSDDEVKLLTGLVLEVVKQNKELSCQNQELTNKLFESFNEVIKNGTNNNTLINNNSHNKTFNLNVFLNEQCKDAMNIMDFVDSLQLQLSDLETVGKLGYVEGISNIIVKNLKALDVCKRPVHCSDSKREVMYVKDQDKWEKENNDKNRLRKAIKRVAYKNSKLIPEFRAKHPDCGKSDSPFSDQYSKLIIEAMGGKGDNDAEKEDKIIKRIAKEVTIDKNL